MAFLVGVELTPEEAGALFARLRARCAYIAETLGDDPTIHDLQVARWHARACRACAIAVATYYDGEPTGDAT